MVTFLLLLCVIATTISLFAVVYGTIHNKKRGRICRYGHGIVYNCIFNRTGSIRVVVMIATSPNNHTP